MPSRRTGLTILFLVTLAFCFSLVLIPRIPQPLAYHDFADQRAWLGIPNFGNVVSNLPFAVFGALGLVFLRSSAASRSFFEPRERWPYFFFFFGFLLTAFGSGYYHWHPDNASLLWDRLPMTIAFMGIIAALITERVSVTAGLYALVPLLLLGAATPVQWYVSELHGHGDLRFYAAVQLSAVLILPLCVFLFPARYTRSSDLAVVAAFYVLAKLFETFDKQIFSIGYIVSGHTLKHLAASLSACWILRMLRLRHPLNRR